MTMTAAQRRSLRRSGKLYRVLTSYVATNLICDHPAVPAVDAPVRWGQMVGFAMVDEQFGYASGGARELSGFQVNLPANPVTGTYYTDGETPVSLQMNEWVCDIYNAGAAAAADGAHVYYVDTAVGPAGDVNYHLVIGAAGAKDAYAGVLRNPSSIAAMSAQKGAILLLLPGGAPTSLT